MEFTIQIDRKAVEYLSRLPKKIRGQIGRKIDKLKQDPHPPKGTKLSDNMYRVRSGDYRIIYSVYKKKILICILKIGNRKDVYK